MQATRFEYRFRFVIHALIYFSASRRRGCSCTSLAGVPGFTTSSTWLVLSSALTKQGWLAFDAATITLLVIALVLTGLGAWLRVWGAAYVGSSIVKSPTMHGDAMLADGPYRRTRNPLYLGTLLHTLGVTILMPPSGAVFAVVLLWIFQVRSGARRRAFPHREIRASVSRLQESRATLSAIAEGADRVSRSPAALGAGDPRRDLFSRRLPGACSRSDGASTRSRYVRA